MKLIWSFIFLSFLFGLKLAFTETVATTLVPDGFELKSFEGETKQEVLDLPDENSTSTILNAVEE